MSSILSQSRDLRRALKQFNELPEIWHARESKSATNEEAATWRELRAMIEYQGFQLVQVYLPLLENDEQSEGEDIWVLRYSPRKEPS